MSKFESTFKAAIAENERRILIDSLRASPDLSLGEIHKLSKGGLGRLFSEITIADLLGTGGSRPAAAPAAKRGRKAAAPAAASAGRGRGKAPKAAKAPKAEAAAEAAPAEGKGAKGRRGKAKAVNTRTAEGRAVGA